MPDFSTWKRGNLESFALNSYQEWVKLKEENERLRMEIEELRQNNGVLLNAWRTEVKRNGQT
jgi:hypothetical protein